MSGADDGVQALADAKPITCVLADAYGVVRDGMHARLRRMRDPKAQVIGASAQGREALWMINVLEPTLALVDLHLPHLDAIEVARAVRSLRVRTRVVIYTSHAEPLLAKRALEAGAAAFVIRGTQHDQLEQALRTVTTGGTYIDSHLAAAVANKELGHLAESELAVLRLLALGMSNTEIARELDVHIETIKSRVSRIAGKLDSTNRTGAVASAVRRGILP